LASSARSGASVSSLALIASEDVQTDPNSAAPSARSVSTRNAQAARPELHRLPGLALDVGDAIVQRGRVRGDPAQWDVQHGISQ
jgi:hypothetical protein